MKKSGIKNGAGTDRSVTRGFALAAAALILLFAVPLTAQDAGTGATAAWRTAEKVWETAQELETPESVLYDPERDVIYVANVAGNPTDKDGNGFITILATDGSIAEREWVSGLDAPKGMGISEGRLFVSDIDTLVEIDTATGVILNRHIAEGALFLNDVAVGPDGTVYVSDYSEENSAIYRLSDGTLEAWITGGEPARPNGLFAEEGRLIAGTADGKLFAVEYESGAVEQIADLSDTIAGIDGIASDGEGNYLVSDWSGAVLRLNLDQLGSEGPAVLFNTSAEGINAADISFAESEGLLLVPTFGDNRIMAYRIGTGE
jgi:sugar lactone lactonase YvrE